MERNMLKASRAYSAAQYDDSMDRQGPGAWFIPDESLRDTKCSCSISLMQDRIILRYPNGRVFQVSMPDDGSRDHCLGNTPAKPTCRTCTYIFVPDPRDQS